MTLRAFTVDHGVVLRGAKELDQPTNSTIDTVWKDKILANLREYITTLDCNTKIVFNILGGETSANY